MKETGFSQVRDKEKALLDEIIQRVNDLFDGEFTEDHVVALLSHTDSKIMENETLQSQAENNTKDQFSHSPDFDGAIIDAIIDGLDTSTGPSKQALENESIRRGLKDILLGPGQIWERLRGEGTGAPPMR